MREAVNALRLVARSAASFAPQTPRAVAIAVCVLDRLLACTNQQRQAALKLSKLVGIVILQQNVQPFWNVCRNTAPNLNM